MQNYSSHGVRKRRFAGTVLHLGPLHYVLDLVVNLEFLYLATPGCKVDGRNGEAHTRGDGTLAR
jgi:hypothetical protein